MAGYPGVKVRGEVEGLEDKAILGDEREPVKNGVVLTFGRRRLRLLEGKSLRRREGLPAFMLQWAKREDSMVPGRMGESVGRRRNRCHG